MPLLRQLIAIATLLAATLASAQTLYYLRDNTGQFYTVNTSTAAPTLVATISAVTSNTIGFTESPTPGILFGTTWTQLISFNADGTNVQTIGSSNAEALGWCTQANVLYGSINGSFFSINPATGAQSPLASPPGGDDVEGLACDHANNVLYGVASGSGTLYRYTPGTESWATVGSTGLSPDSLGLAYDPGANVLYLLNGNTGDLYRVSPSTAAATLIGNLGLGAVGGGLAFAGASAPPASAQPVPTLSESLLFVLMAATLLLGLGALRRRR
jgi:hypothetical protein